MKVLITGTASGIGKGCAEFFLKENHEVYGFDKNISSIQHPKYTHFCLDIRDKNSYPEIGPVDILINNAGVQNGDDIDVNLKGTISVTEHYGIFIWRNHFFRIHCSCTASGKNTSWNGRKLFCSSVYHRLH